MKIFQNALKTIKKSVQLSFKRLARQDRKLYLKQKLIERMDVADNEFQELIRKMTNTVKTAGN